MAAAWKNGTCLLLWSARHVPVRYFSAFDILFSVECSPIFLDLWLLQRLSSIPR
jgi:hypothetical protein